MELWVLLLAAAAAGTGASHEAPFHAAGSSGCSACHSERAAGGAEGNRVCLDCHDAGGPRARERFAGRTAPKVAGAVEHELPGGRFDPAGPANGHTLAGWPGALSMAPGGSFPSSTLTCTACHDPHGGLPFRALRRRVNDADVGETVAGTAEDRADLVRPGAGADGNAAIGPANHNVYRGDMSAWCAACHSWSHGGHPTGVPLTPETAANYGPLSDFSIPLETSSPGARTDAEWTVAVSESRVFCLTCHQAHGTGFRDALRWDPARPSGGSDLRRGGCGRCHDL